MKKLISILAILATSVTANAQTYYGYSGGGGGGGGGNINPGTVTGQIALWNNGTVAWEPSSISSQLYWDSATNGLLVHPIGAGSPAITVVESDSSLVAARISGDAISGEIYVSKNSLPAHILRGAGPSILNENGSAECDIRMEATGKPFMFFLDAGTGNIGINEPAPTGAEIVVSSTVQPQIRLVNGATSTTVRNNASGDLVFAPSGGNVGNPALLDSESFGLDTLVGHNFCSAFGHGATAQDTGSGVGNASAFGEGSLANGYYSLSLGSDSTSGANSVAVGGMSVSGANAVAVGTGSNATATGTAIGRLAVAGSTSVAIGYNSVTTTNATAFGFNARGNHNPSIALGSQAITTAANQFMVGDTDFYIANMVFNEFGQTSPRNVTIVSGGMSGTNLASGSLSLSGGYSTGNAAGGGVYLKVAKPGTTGTGINTPVNIVEANHSLTEIQTDANVNGVFDADALQITTYVTPAPYSAQQDNLAPAGYDAARIVRVSTTGANVNISGVAKLANRVLVFVNVGTSGNVVFLHDNTGSIEENRVLLTNNANETVLRNGSIKIWHDPVDNKWREIR